MEVRHAEVVGDDFEVISGATDKQYRYRIWNAAHRPLGLRHLVYHCWVPLDAEAMVDAARRLVGEHDFAAFTNAGHGRTSTIRTIHACHLETHPLTHDACGPVNVLQNVHRSGDQRTTDTGQVEAASTVPAGGREIHLVIRGSGFLYNMVRIIAGSLLEVGRGHWPPHKIDELLQTGDRQTSGPTLPPTGLCLEWIRYG